MENDFCIVTYRRSLSSTGAFRSRNTRRTLKDSIDLVSQT